MKTSFSNFEKTRFIFTGYALALGIFCAIILTSSFAIGASVSQIAGDGYNVSSFTVGTNWSDSSIPIAANDYTTNTTLRTPATTGNFTFGGNSLTITSSGLLAYKGTSAGNTITINNLHLQSGSITNWTTTNFILAGSIILDSGYTGYLQSSDVNAGYTITSTISGGGRLQLSPQSSIQTSFAITLSGNNSYSGGTVINNYTYLVATSANALGIGDVRINGGLLTLQNSSAIDDSGRLILVSGLAAGRVALEFSDTMTIAGLSLDGGSTYISSGTYSISALNSLYGSNVFLGDGAADSAMIQVIPETPTSILLLLSIILLTQAALVSKNISSVERY